jgi:hypothetical protein
LRLNVVASADASRIALLRAATRNLHKELPASARDVRNLVAAIERYHQYVEFGPKSLAPLHFALRITAINRYANQMP